MILYKTKPPRADHRHPEAVSLWHAASEVNSYEALLICAEATKGTLASTVPQYMSQLDPARDSRSAIIFAENAILNGKGREALEYYKQAISPLAINHLRDARHCLLSYKKNCARICALDSIEQNDIHLFMLEKCITLIDCGDLLEASNALKLYHHNFYRFTDKEPPTIIPYYGYLDSRNEYTDHLLDVIKTIRAGIEAGSTLYLNVNPI